MYAVWSSSPAEQFGWSVGRPGCYVLCQHLSVCVQDADCPPELQPFLTDEEAEAPPVVVYGEETPVQCLRSQAFWLLFVTSAITSGCGLTLLNNLAQMVSVPVHSS